MHYILQVLGKFEGYHLAKFEIDGKSYRASLSSKALQEHFGKEYKVLLLVPESMAQMLARSEDEALRLLSDSDGLRERVMEKVSKEGLVDGPFDVLIMQSIGEYPASGHSYALVFENTVENVISSTFSQLLSLLNGAKAIIVDISTGQNLYVTSLLEAVRGVLVHEKLRSILQDRADIDVKVAYIPPVLSKGQKVRVEFSRYDIKAFFELPIKGKNVNLSKLVEPLHPDQGGDFSRKINEKIGNLTMHISTGRLAYNAIKYNAPLFLFHNEISNRLKRVEGILDFPKRFKEIIDELENEYKEVCKGDGKIIVRRGYRIDKDLYFNIHFHLALLNSIYNFWKCEVDGREPELSYIRETFPKVYEKLGLGLNARFLERDCNEISEKIKNYEGDLTQPKLLSEIIEESSKCTQKARPEVKSSDDKRNFFAHSGLLSNMVMVSRRDDRIYLKYKDDELEKMRSWIDDPEG